MTYIDMVLGFAEDDQLWHEDALEMERHWKAADAAPQTIIRFSANPIISVLSTVWDAQLLKLAIPAISGWLVGRNQRKVHFRLGNDEYTVTSTRELERVVEIALRIRNQLSGPE